MLVLATVLRRAAERRSNIKSCIITFDMAQKVAGLKLKNRVVLSFDDYGMKECRET